MLAIQSQLVLKFSRVYERLLHVVLGWTRLEEVLDSYDYEAQPYFPFVLLSDSRLRQLTGVSFRSTNDPNNPAEKIEFPTALALNLKCEIYCVKADKHVMYSVSLANFNKVTYEASFHWSGSEVIINIHRSIQIRSLATYPSFNEQMNELKKE